MGEYMELNMLITNSNYYDPKTDTTRGFEMRISYLYVAESGVPVYSESGPGYSHNNGDLTFPSTPDWTDQF
jgi:hypothetical protein